MSELELSMFRQRSQEALKQKARRGALVLGVVAGYVKIGRDRIEKNPDKRVQHALQLVFTKFAELQSARQVHIWLREEGIELPVESRQGEAHGVVWRLPAYNIVHAAVSPTVVTFPAIGSPSARVGDGGGVQGRRQQQRNCRRGDSSEFSARSKKFSAIFILGPVRMVRRLARTRHWMPSGN
jgi:hypothetical protein